MVRCAFEINANSRKKMVMSLFILNFKELK